MSKPILCVDFDGVLHSYTSGWRGADIIPDPPVDGAMKFLWDATEHFRVAIFSSRSSALGGMSAMQNYIKHHFTDFWRFDRTTCDDKLAEIEWPITKPSAFVTIDDRAITFDGVFPSIEVLKNFKPWNKRPLGAPGTFSDGKISDDDEGDLRIGVAYDKLDGLVRVDFGKLVAWFALPPENTIALAKVLLQKAGAKTIDLTF